MLFEFSYNIKNEKIRNESLALNRYGMVQRITDLIMIP